MHACRSTLEDPTDYEGEPARIALIIDNTARNKALRQAQRIFDTSQDLILVTDIAGKILRVNPSVGTVLGYREEDIVGRNARDLVIAEDLEAVGNEIRATRKGLSKRQLRVRNVHKDGRHVSIDWMAVWSEADGHLYFVGRDMTNLERAEEQLRQSQKMEAVGQLTGGVAHDFNNILMVILANVEALEHDQRLHPQLRTQIAGIDKAAQRAADLTSQLLAFSRKQALRPQPTNANDLVTATGDLLRRTLGEQIEIQCVLAGDLWNIEVDRSQLQSALVNVSLNARDAMPQGGRLLIETGNTALDEDYAAQHVDVMVGDYVMIAISDNGTGIPPEQLDRVFEPFFTTKGPDKGTGLGLSMVYGFIRQSNGHIKIYSEPGRGTSVRLYFPRADAPATQPVAAPPQPLPSGNERILVVEDDHQVRSTVVGQLHSLGYNVTEACDAASAVSILEAAPAPFDLVLTDVMMPGALNGKGLGDEVMRRWPGTGLVYMSGYTESAMIHHGRLDPDVTLLSKPFRKHDLARTVRQVLDGKAG